MKPSMQVENVGENKQDRDVTRDSLPDISPIACKSVLLVIRVSTLGDPDSSHRVEDDRSKNKSPLDQRQKRDGMDRKNVILEGRCTRHQARICQQVNTHVSADRYETTEGMQSPDQELVSLEKV